MFKTRLQDTVNPLPKAKASTFLLRQADKYLSPIQGQLDRQIDKRLVRTFYDMFIAILTFRNRAMGLLLSELGAYICGPARAAAGTKRLSNLLRSPKWKATLIDQFFWQRTKDRLEELRQKRKRPLLLWDDSRVEKHESWFSEGLCSVESSKAKRRMKIKRGYYRPPAGRVCVPGFNWTAVLLSHLGGIPSVCEMRWWTTRGKYKELGSNIVYRMLRQLHQQIGRLAVHVFDRGYANSEMIGWLIKFEQDFIIRWKKNLLLVHAEKGSKQTHQLARSFPARKSRLVYDKERKMHKRLTLAWTKVQHPDYPDHELTLLIVRDKSTHSSPMYLLTSLAVEHAGIAWEILFSYMHRWEVEQGFRFGKSELALESPRLWFWDNRRKLMAIVALVYDFLLRMVRDWPAWVQPFVQTWCHRTGERYRQASIPLYRLRLAISYCLTVLWAQNSG